jgi:hypothetical protein
VETDVPHVRPFAVAVFSKSDHSSAAVSCQLYASRNRVLWIVTKLFYLVLIYWPLDNFLCEVLNNLGGGRDKFIAQAIDIPQKGIFLRII